MKFNYLFGNEIINMIYGKEGVISKETFKFKFQEIIDKAKAKAEDWMVGEIFSKFNSEARFGFIKDVNECKKIYVI